MDHRLPNAALSLQIVVHGLPWSTEWQELKDLAKEHGDVIKADVMRRPDGKSRGFGTIVFKTPEDAQAAIEVRLPCSLHALWLCAPFAVQSHMRSFHWRPAPRHCREVACRQYQVQVRQQHKCCYH